jgi:hypothetical protein
LRKLDGVVPYPVKLADALGRLATEVDRRAET